MEPQVNATISSTMRQQVYRIYLDYLETPEAKRRWSVFNDVPWDKLDIGKASNDAGDRVEVFCTEELYLPDYSSKGLALLRSMFGLAWFQSSWAFEESMHGLAFREYLIRSGLRSPAQFEPLEGETFSKKWQLPFQTT